MFILRQIPETNIEINTCLGAEYVYVNKLTSPNEFNRIFKLLEWKPEDMPDEIHGFITFDMEKQILPLFPDRRIYVMGSDGKTIDNLTLRQ